MISSGSPTDRTGAPGNTPTTPKPLNAPAAAEATSVPCPAEDRPGVELARVAGEVGVRDVDEVVDDRDRDRARRAAARAPESTT